MGMMSNRRVVAVNGDRANGKKDPPALGPTGNALQTCNDE